MDETAKLALAFGIPVALLLAFYFDRRLYQRRLAYNYRRTLRGDYSKKDYCLQANQGFALMDLDKREEIIVQFNHWYRDQITQVEAWLNKPDGSRELIDGWPRLCENNIPKLQLENAINELSFDRMRQLIWSGEIGYQQGFKPRGNVKKHLENYSSRFHLNSEVKCLDDKVSAKLSIDKLNRLVMDVYTPYGCQEWKAVIKAIQQKCLGEYHEDNACPPIRRIFVFDREPYVAWLKLSGIIKSIDTVYELDGQVLAT